MTTLCVTHWMLKGIITNNDAKLGHFVIEKIIFERNALTPENGKGSVEC
jgi:hypothetical protein